jgi:hypothetical protein
MQKRTSKEFQLRLKALIEGIVTEECRLPPRGLFFLVQELEVKGNPPEQIEVTGMLHFLPLGSPFCCMDADCHLCLFADRLETVSELVRNRLHLRQAVQLQFTHIGVSAHDGVEFDDWNTGRSPSLDWGDVDRRDALGRTELWRAAARGYDRLVEDLLAAGADPRVTDSQGRNILEFLGPGDDWLRTVLKDAMLKRRA